MQGAFQIFLYDNDKMIPVDSIPADQVCTFYIGGNGIVNETRGARLGDIVKREILANIDKNVPNYVVVYDALDVSNNRPERLVEMDKNGDNVLPSLDGLTPIYLTEKNLDDVFRRRILPLIIRGGPRFISKTNFAYDGDAEEIFSRFISKVRKSMLHLGFPEKIIDGTINITLAHMVPYAEYSPEYPNEMFNHGLLPRITDDAGRRLDIDTALRHVRKINILALCHGAHVLHMMEDKMSAEMRRLGYTPTEIRRIMAQVLSVSLAPSCALGKSKFQSFSFISAYDYVADRPNNWVQKYVAENLAAERDRFNAGDKDWQWNLAPMFLGGQYGNVFVVKQRFEFESEAEGPNMIGRDEHNNAHYFPGNNATMNGRLFGILAHNILVNGIKNSIAQDEKHTPLPPVEELVLDESHADKLSDIFTKMLANGNDFIRSVRGFVAEKTPAIHAR